MTPTARIAARTARSRTARTTLAVLAAAGAVLLLGSCAAPEPNLAQVAERSMVGMTASQVMSCAGVPHRTTGLTGLEYYTYSNAIYESAPGTSLGIGIGGGGSGSGVSFGAGIPLGGGTGIITNQTCEVTLTLSDGVVRDVNYTAIGGVGPQRYRLCNDIVRACVQPTGTGAAAPISN